MSISRERNGHARKLERRREKNEVGQKDRTTTTILILQLVQHSAFKNKPLNLSGEDHSVALSSASHFS